MSAEFWVGVSFFIFLGIVAWAGGFKTLFAGIDSRGERIAKELAEAKRLREEAENLLKQFEAKKREAEKEADDLVASAKVEAERLKAEASQKLDDFVRRRTQQAELKIAQAEAQATAEVRSAAADLAVQAASRILAEKGTSDDTFKAALGEIKSKLN